jgi:hypothetical protein
MSQKPRTLKDLHRKSRQQPNIVKYWLNKYLAGQLTVSHGDAWRALRKYKIVKKDSLEFTRLGEAVIKEMRDAKALKHQKSDRSGKGDTGEKSGDDAD